MLTVLGRGRRERRSTCVYKVCVEREGNSTLYACVILLRVMRERKSNREGTFCVDDVGAREERERSSTCAYEVCVLRRKDILCVQYFLREKRERERDREGVLISPPLDKPLWRTTSSESILKTC